MKYNLNSTLHISSKYSMKYYNAMWRIQMSLYQQKNSPVCPNRTHLLKRQVCTVFLRPKTDAVKYLSQGRIGNRNQGWRQMHSFQNPSKRNLLVGSDELDFNKSGTGFLIFN